MATSYPSNIDNFNDPTPTSPMNNPSHSGEHANANDAIVAIETAVGTSGNPNFLPITGGTMQGAIAMGSHKITGLANGVASSDAATVGQIPGVSGFITSVTAGDTSISVGGTATAPTIETGTLDVIASDHPPAANWSNNSKKITSLANGSASSDAAAFGQIPTALSSLSGNIVNTAVAGQDITVSSATGNVTIGIEGQVSVNVVSSSAGTSQTLAAVATDVGNDITLQSTDNLTVTMPSAAAGAYCYCVVRQPASGTTTNTVTFTGVKWPGGTAPTMSTGASAVDRYDFWSDGTSWFGVIAGQKFS